MTSDKREQNLRRLLAPRHIAVFGGKPAAEAVRQCKQIGFKGEIWPVHPRHESVEGYKCYRSVAELPSAPDASFIAVPREATVEIVTDLNKRGAGGVVCYASGFAEVGDEGAALQRQLVDSAADMAVIGPNCYGVLNYLDGAALWPDQHGGARVERGVAIITQSGNVGLNLTMQRRSLPLAYLIAVGNKAGTNVHELIEALLEDPRVSAIGLHLEGLDDVAGFSRAALKALKRRIPLVALKSGSSDLGAQVTVSHTSSLAGPDGLYDALFKRLGIARVYDPTGLIETLKFLHVHGAINGKRIISASCSGGEASLTADLAQPRGLEMPKIPEAARQRLYNLLGDKVSVANPLDYHTYIWADLEAQTECFTGLMDCKFDSHLLILDFPRDDRCRSGDWDTTLAAFVAARHKSGATAMASVVASMPEGLPESVGNKMLAEGIAPMQGLVECLDAIRAAADIGAAQARVNDILPLVSPPASSDSPKRMLNEWDSKRALVAHGLTVPEGNVVSAAEAAAYADKLGYPVVVKAVSDTLAHKTEAGGVKLNLKAASDVRTAIESMKTLSDRFLIERMAQDVIAELIVGVHRDPQFGLALTVGTGGIMVELLKDAATVLLPASRNDIRAALESLKTYPLLTGFRGRPAGDIDAVLDAVIAVARYAEANRDQLQELDVNPLLVMPKGKGVVAVDALIRVSA
ncbi:MAG: acetate--CoA ligase family protein [Gammaproteobacteria bacterium]|nr:acetate--CoA ligase family protein [Gammaproteobacteria bacterium]